MIHAVIFDLDGVICSTDEYHYQAWKQVADEEGIYFDRTINNQLRGISRMDSLNVILKRAKKEYTEEEKEKLAEKKNTIYLGLLENMTEADCPKDVRSALEWLRKKNIQTAIGSSSTNTKVLLQKLKIENLFDVVVDGSDVEKAKPDPEIFLLAAKKLGCNPDSVLVVEDAFSGIQAAKKGGFLTAGIGEAASYYQTDYPLKTVADVILTVSHLNSL
jgi:beta-phosphoglucomutase